MVLLLIGIVIDLGDILINFLCLLISLCLLSMPLLIETNIEPLFIDYVALTNIIGSWSTLSLQGFTGQEAFYNKHK